MLLTLSAYTKGMNGRKVVKLGNNHHSKLFVKKKVSIIIMSRELMEHN